MDSEHAPDGGVMRIHETFKPLYNQPGPGGIKFIPNGIEETIRAGTVEVIGGSNVIRRFNRRIRLIR